MLNQSTGLDALFRGLADPARRAMIERLAQGPMAVSELARPLPMSLPAAMQHLRVLETAGLVRSSKNGRVRTCAIEPQALDLLEQWLSARRSEWQQRLERLDDYVQIIENEGENHDTSE
ncbi:MAG TPA: metalloregulator ArsR/SmtB family transcription factor [Stellaceae bacterium]|nr:metalloregulator ArsR/SmtB family transcription factor [Stellaceae bacterium]